MSRAVLGLGTNLGDRAGNLRAALEALGRLPGTRVEAVSSVWQTAPFDVPDRQQDYWNVCVSLETALSPHALLGACLGVEAALGRVRRTYHGARVIDIDLLLYDGAAFAEKELTVPHPGVLQRAFVLFPLRELFPEQRACGLNFADAPGFADANGVLCLGPAEAVLQI